MMITLYIADKSACLQVPTYSYGQFYEAMPSQGCYLTDNTHWESWLRELASQSCNWMRPSPQQSVEIQQQQQQFESLSSSSSFQQQQSTVTSSSTQQILNGSFEVSQTGGESTEPSGKLEVVLKKKKKPMKDCLSKPLEQSALNSFGSVLVPLKWQWLCSTNCELPTECISLCSEMPGLSNEDHLTRIRSLFAFAKTWQELLANKARLVCLFGIFAFIWTGGSFGFAEYRHLKTKTRSSGISEIISFWTKNNLEWLHWKFWRNIHVWSCNPANVRETCFVTLFSFARAFSLILCSNSWCEWFYRFNGLSADRSEHDMGDASIVDHDHATLGTYDVHCDPIVITVIELESDIYKHTGTMTQWYLQWTVCRLFVSKVEI